MYNTECTTHITAWLSCLMVRDISVENVDSRLNDTVCKTVIEHISEKIAALLDQEHLIFPNGYIPWTSWREWLPMTMTP